MDFLEGSLLGPEYSDTLYGERKHRGKFVLVFLQFYILLAFFLKNSANFSIGIVFFMQLILLLAALFVSPFLNRVYYELPLMPRFLILFVQVLKRFFALNLLALALVQFIKESSIFNSRFLLEVVGNQASDLFTLMSAKFNLLGLLVTSSIFMFIGIVSLFLLLNILFFLPNFVLFLVGQIQRLWDSIVKIKKRN